MATMNQQSRNEVIQHLKVQLGQLERNQARPKEPLAISSGVQAFDQLLPREGLAMGMLMEWLSAGYGSGVATLALVLAGSMPAQCGAAVVIDDSCDFYPPAAVALGISPHRTLVVQPGGMKDTLWAWEQ